MIQRNCATCGNGFTYEPRRGRPQNYCQPQCRPSRNKKTEPVTSTDNATTGTT